MANKNSNGQQELLQLSSTTDSTLVLSFGGTLEARLSASLKDLKMNIKSVCEREREKKKKKKRRKEKRKKLSISVFDRNGSDRRRNALSPALTCMSGAAPRRAGSEGQLGAGPHWRKESEGEEDESGNENKN
jgi:hypothetical protein